MSEPSAGGAPAPAPAPKGVRWKQLGFAALAILLVGAIVVGTIVVVGGSDDSASAAEVELQPVASAGANPFMPSVGTDQNSVTPPPAATSASGSVASYSGDLPGLYGGTRNVSNCDAEKVSSSSRPTPTRGVRGPARSGSRRPRSAPTSPV